MTNVKKLLMAAAGAGGGAGLDVDEVFSTYLYEGNNSTQTITNGIDLDGEGGLVWIKSRSDTQSHELADTVRGNTKFLRTNSTTAERTSTSGDITAFNSSGFSLGASTTSGVNSSGNDYASWTFRKAPKFFDVLTYTGNGTSQTIAHNLGTTVGSIFVKCTTNTYDWAIYHRSLGGGYYLRTAPYGTDAAGATTQYWNNTDATSQSFTVGSNSATNYSGQTYVAYIFAHNDSGDGGFGPDGDADIIKCGTYNGTGSAGNEINLGFEPQWLMIKRTNATSDWVLFDAMRGLTKSGNNGDRYLYTNSSDAEGGIEQIAVTPTGFTTEGGWGEVNNSSGTYIYVAIRRGPMAAPTSSTNVFDMESWTGNNTGSRVIDTDVTHDTALLTDRASGNYFSKGMYNRLTGDNVFVTSSGQPDSYWAGTATRLYHDIQTGIELPSNAAQWNSSSDNFIGYFWKRAPSFFDVVTFKRSSVGAVDHNLGVAPKMIWVKGGNVNQDWYVYHEDLGNSAYLRINESGAATTSTNATWNSVSPTATQFTIGGYLTAYEYTAWLFGSVDGVSKVGSYTGNGSSSGPTIDCGFSSGPKWVLIKRATGGSNDNWAVFDTTRGLSSGNDHYFALENNDSEFSNVDWIDPTNAGFQVVQTNSSVNANGSTYIFYAIAA